MGGRRGSPAVTFIAREAFCWFQSSDDCRSIGLRTDDNHCLHTNNARLIRRFAATMNSILCVAALGTANQTLQSELGAFHLRPFAFLILLQLFLNGFKQIVADNGRYRDADPFVFRTRIWAPSKRRIRSTKNWRRITKQTKRSRKLRCFVILRQFFVPRILL